jgi:hypothetical protein
MHTFYISVVVLEKEKMLLVRGGSIDLITNIYIKGATRARYEISHSSLMINDVTLKRTTHLASSKCDIDLSFEYRPDKCLI